MKKQNPDGVPKVAGKWLSPREFAVCIGSSVHFVHNRLKADDIPRRNVPGVAKRSIHRKHIKRYKPYPEHVRLFSTEDVIAQTNLSKQDAKKCESILKQNGFLDAQLIRKEINKAEIT